MNILVINGPNLNLLGSRDAAFYGTKTLTDIEGLMTSSAQELGLDVDFFQSNHEGAIIDYLQGAATEASGIIINAGALSHCGLSLRDALVDSRLPIVEVHISNIHAREEFRRHSVIAPIAVGQVAGVGWQGYLLALEYLATRLKTDEGS